MFTSVLTKCCRSTVAVLFLTLSLGISMPVYGQFNGEAFTQQAASSLYDEWGFQRGSALTFDGNAIVSNATGQLSYTYPISTHSVKGVPIQTTLNYSGSVAFTSFKEYTSSTLYNAGPNTGDCFDIEGWEKFTMNRPAWIIGVNGFAVQVLGATHGFANDYRLVTFNICRGDYTYEDLTWAIDGYDFCNRMEDLQAAGYSQSNPHVDVIRLLRSDGSVLELVNSNDPGGNENDLYTGHYYTNTPNARDFAIVEYDESLWPSFLPSSDLGRAELKPRRVRYYPGDGTEYVFRERIAPYGLMEYNDDIEGKHKMYPSPKKIVCRITNTQTGLTENIHQAGIMGKQDASPTIFYLDEIRNAQGQVTSFTYSRHNSPNEAPTRGRAQIRGFSGHSVAIGDGQVNITALGRNISLVLGRSVVTGVGDEFHPDQQQLCPLKTFETQSQRYGDNLYTHSEVAKSTLGYVTKIIERIDEGRDRTTDFDYDVYERVYRNWRFPHKGSNSWECTPAISQQDVIMQLQDLRLSEIVEPAQKYEFCYYDSKNDLSCSESPAPSIDIRPDVPNSYTDKVDFPYLRNNIIANVKKFALSGSPLTTQTYTYTFPYDATLAEYRGVAETSSLVSVDHVASTTHTTDFTYIFDRLPRIRDYLVRGSFSDVVKVVESDGNQTTKTTTKYSEGILSTYTYVPVSRVVEVEQLSPSPTSVIKSAVEYSYTLEEVRDYDGAVANYITGDPTLASVMGKGVLEQSATQMDPSTVTYVSGEPDVTTGTPYRVSVTTYKNFPYAETSLSKSWTAWDEKATEKNYNLNGASGQEPFEEVAFDPGILVTATETLGPTVKLPPILGLVEERYLETPGGSYLRGSEKTYQTSAYDNGSSTFRGMLLSDKAYGPGKLTQLPGNQYRYTEWWNKSLPAEVENANGAIARTYYNFEIPDLFNAGTQLYELPEGSILRNTDQIIPVVLPSEQYFSHLYEKPVASENPVRKYDPSGLLTTDNLRSYQELTYGGNPTYTLDKNGWISRASYDPLGRLQMAWLPFDFPVPTPAPHSREIDLNRKTIETKRIDEVLCNSDGSGKTVTPGVPTTTDYSSLVAGYNKTIIPDCPDCDPGQSSCSTEFVGHKDFTGYLDYTVQTGDKLEAILASELTAARLRLVVNGSTPCTTLEVDIPILGFRKSYLFNCEAVDRYDESGGGIGSGTTGGDPDQKQATVQSGGGLGNGYFYVDLMDAKDAIESLSNNSHIEIFLRVKNPGAYIEFSNFTEATRPLLYVDGTFSVGNPSGVVENTDYTLAVNVDDENLTSEIFTKVDDKTHTAQTGGDWPVTGDVRHTKTEHQFGHDYKVEYTDVTIGDPGSPIRVDRTEYTYDGRANMKTVKDADANTTASETDAFGRTKKTTNADGSTVLGSFETGTPADAGLSPSDPDYGRYFGYTYVETVEDEAGIPMEKYYDAFDRLVRQRNYLDYPNEPVDVLYEYDLLNQLIEVTHPDGGQTQYTYDEFGRTLTKENPDLGLTSYAYDDVGNMRFVQSEQQASDDRMTFYEYDDLNRTTIVGEAVFSDQTHEGTPVGPPGGGRWTSYLDPTVLHDDNASAILTSNQTLWLDPAGFGQTVPNYASVPAILGCFQVASQVPEATPPFIVHTAETFAEDLTVSTAQDFENLAKHPHNVRVAISYDELPASSGAVWQHFPSQATWDALAPTGAVRNLEGREAAVAYREHGGQPYHFNVLSYDERGRVEALLRYTENLGFDAVYYEYNSGNQLISVTTADPVRQHTTWYAYDANGRVEKVWTLLGNSGSGVGAATGSPSYPAALTRPSNPDITYTYTKTNQVEQMSYPDINVDIDYTYNNRLWLKELDANQSGTDLFNQFLTHDARGLITQQSFQHGTGSITTQTYTNDDRRQLTDWTSTGMTPSRTYQYDDMGNRRTEGGLTNLFGDNLEHIYGFTDPFGPNRLTEVIVNNLTQQIAYPWLSFSYDGNGSLLQKKEFDNFSTLIREENFAYSSWRNLLYAYEDVNPLLPPGSNAWEWGYRYNAMGEREQKRMTSSPNPDIVLPNDYEWSYYLLGGGKEQRALFNGVQTSQTVCGNNLGLSRVYLYPEEYLVYGTSEVAITQKVNTSKEYRITDHLGSCRVVLANNGNVLLTTDYEPFGKPLNVGQEDRLSWIGKEQDAENSYGNFGVRAYDYDIGRFTSIDPLWEKFYLWTPYQYAYNGPTQYKDPTGTENLYALAWALKNMAGKGIPFAEWYGGNGGWTFQPGTVPTETVCYESCWTSYMNSGGNITDKLKASSMARNGAFYGRNIGIKWFKEGKGEIRKFETDIMKGELGDIMFLGNSGGMEGHAVLLASAPAMESVIDASGNRVQRVKVKTLSTGSDADYENYGIKIFEFELRNGIWHSLDVLDSNTNHDFRGYGQLNEEVLKGDPSLLEGVNFETLTTD